jgi:hypothetical protein
MWLQPQGETFMTVYYAQTSGVHQTTASSPTPIPGLTVKIPAGVGDQILVILNIPNPYAEGNDSPGGWFGIAVDGTIQPAYAQITTTWNTTGRMPTTLVIAVELKPEPQKIEGMWQSIRGSTVIIDSPATLSATL